MDIGLAELGKENGVPQLVARLRTLIFPQQSSEARELYKIGQQKHGPLSRQQSESMTSYIQRRKRWWQLLTQMDKTLAMSDVMLGELLLEHAGLTSTERLMVMTSTNNDLSFDKVAEAMVKQDALTKESTRDYRSGKGKGGKKGHWRNNASRGYLAYDGEEDYDYPEEEYDQGGEAYLGYDTSGYDGWESWGDVTAWYHDWDDWSQEDETADAYEGMIDSCTPEELADPALMAANLQAAYLSGEHLWEYYKDPLPAEAYWTKGKSKGKGKGKFKGKFRNKGKGFGKWKGGKKGYPGGNLSLEDRRKRLQEFKSKTKCQDCGKIGHWAGDPECPKNSKKASAHIAFARKMSAESEDGVEIPAGSGDKPPTALMALRGDDLLGELALDWPDDVEIASSSGGVGTEVAVTDATLRQLKGHDTLCRFPQYKGYTFREVVLRDVDFTEWIMDTSRNHKALEIRQFQAWLNHHLKKTLNGLKIKRVEERTPPTFPMETPTQMTPIRPQNAQCVDGCTWSYAGSNAYVEQKTCKICGYREKRSKDKPLAIYSPETCPHQITDKRGSSKSMSRIYCLQCQSIVSEMPQQIARQRQETAKKIEASTEDTMRLAQSLISQEDTKMPKRLAIECLKEVARQVNLYPEDEEIRASDVVKMLQDTFDTVSLKAEDQGVPPVAMMHWSGYTRDEWSNWEPENPMPIHGCPDLRVVDILNDDGVWAILDEGCNMTCHSKSWRMNAQQKLQNLGFTMECLVAQKEYNGVGSTATKASTMLRIPFSVKPLDEKVKTLCGVIESYELEFEHDNFVPLLLSLPNQATLGLMKDMRNGTAFLKDYQVEIELCKAKQNNLLCINIGALGEALKFREKLPRNLRPLRIGSEDWLETFSGGKRKCLMPPPAASSAAMTSTTTTSEDKKMRRTDSERKEFDRFVERDPSTWSREEIERFHDMEDKAFGNVYPTDVAEHDTWSPPSSPGADLNDSAQASEEAAMVAHGRPEDDEVKKTGGGWKDNPPIRKPSEDLLRHVYIVCCGLDFEMTKYGQQSNGQGGGEKGAKSILKDKELHQRIEQLGRQIKEFTRRKDYAGKNMVIVVVGHGLGLGPETRIARAVHTWTAMKWSDKSRVRLFNFAKEDFPSFCTSGRSAESERANTGFYHQGILKLVGEKLGLPDDCDEWGRLTYEKEEDEAREKREARERRRQERERERKEKEKHEEKDKSRGRECDKAGEKPRRERSRSGKRLLKSQARPDDATEALEFVTRLNEVNLRKLCQGLKACGMLEDGINYLYQEGTPMEQAKKVVKILQLGPRTISSLAEVEFKKPSPTDASGSRTKPPEPMGPPPGREKTEKPSSKKAVDVKTPEEEQMEAHKQKMKQELMEAKEAKKRRREKEEKRDSLSESYSEEEEIVEEDPPKAPGAIVLRENNRKDEKDDDVDMPEESYDEGQSWQDWNDWNEEDWQDRESRDYERERFQRRSKGYEKGKGKGRGKSKIKGKDKGKKGLYNRSWWTAPRISEKDLMATLLKKANRHQAEWQEMPRNKLTWETLKSEEDDELISVRICVKKSPRHTAMNIPVECKYWRKFSVMLPSVDDAWEECEKNTGAHDTEEFDEEKRPLLFMACIISGNCIAETEEEERTEEPRTREYNSLGEEKTGSAFYATSTMSSVSANLCNEGIWQMFIENDLIRSSFTGDGKTAERYMALAAAAAGTGELTGYKCKTWTHSNKSNLGVLICLGCKTSFAPAGHEVMDDLESPGKMLKKLDAEYYPQATVILGEQVDEERMKEIIITLNTKGGSLTVVTPQFGFQDTVLRTVGLDAMVIRVIAELQLVGKDAVQHVLTQSVMAKNSMLRVKGVAPSQWVIGKLPKEAGSIMDEENWADLGALTAADNPTLEFGQITRIREKARKAGMVHGEEEEEDSGSEGSGVDMAERGYNQTNLATEENQDEWHYDEKMGILIREHKTPRIALFSLENMTDCPVPIESLTKGRITEVDYLEGKSTVMQDSWQNDYGVKMLGREWTGKTIFLTQSRKKEERPKVDDNVVAFIAARFDAVVSKNSKKKE
eukprot:symbB.v1.2.004358.t1/scaffold240.1/size264318/14